MLKQIKNILRLANMEQKVTVDRKVVLEAPKGKLKKKLAIVVELDKPNMFPEEPTIEI